jgi:hypothetical protein
MPHSWAFPANGALSIYRYTSQLGLAVLDVVVISILIGSSLIAINVFFDVVDRTFVARPPGLSLSSYLLRLAGATALFLLGFLSLGGLGAVGAARFYDWATRPDIAPTWRIVAVLVVTLVVSVGLFLFRLKARCVYGCTEALAGLYAAQSVTTGDKHGLPFFFALLTAGVYLYVRGLDNMHQGATKPPLDPVWIYLKAWLRPRTAAAQAERTGAEGE